MKAISILHALPWIAASLSLSACIQSEKSCYDKLKSDFDSSFAFAKDKSCLSLGAEACASYALAAATSNLQINSIFHDDDQSACDFYSDGPHLRKK